jgi:uncharacterized protein with von Willebrand factor type A (vWA) domain
MQVRYTAFDKRFLELARQEQLKNLFLELLMHTGGNVKTALDWLSELADRHGLWPEETDLEKFTETLTEEGLISSDHRPGKGKMDDPSRSRYVPTRKAERAIRTNAFDELFTKMRQDSIGGDHVTPHSGAGGERLPETRPYMFGDRIQDLDCVGSVSNALRRQGVDQFEMTEDDLAVYEVEQSTSCATVLALDISHSMILYGEDRITPAKKVALALTELIQSRFRKDALDVILFGDEAFELDPRQLPYVQVGPYHTNTKAALELGQRILARKKHANKQIVMITDGKPSAISVGSRLYINSFGLDARIVNATIEEAQKCRRHGIILTTFMITSDPYLKQFIERLSEANKGRAYYADLNNLGKFVMMDYVRNRRMKKG